MQSASPHGPGPTTFDVTHLNSPVSLSTEYDAENTRSDDLDSHDPDSDQHLPPKKRQFGSKGRKRDERKKVSRACDSCKLKKIRCSGKQPCNRCSNQSLQCHYNAEHRRGRPALPEQVLPVDTFKQNGNDSTQNFQQPSCRDLNPSVSGQSKQPFTSYGLRKSTRSSQEPDDTVFEGDYIGPTSGIAFLHRAQRRFQQDFVRSPSNSSNGHSSKEASIFSFGDGWIPDQLPSILIVPERRQARDLFFRYFDFAMPTYRFLHRATAEGWLEKIYHEKEQGDFDVQNLSTAKVAIVLLVLATAKLYEVDDSGSLHDGKAGDAEQSCIIFAAAELKLAKETGPARLESVQARLAQCIYLLASSRINQAWYIFGTAAQIILALGLHRQRFSQSVDSIKIGCRKRVFWSAYTLDRYLSVILGRPRIFRDEDVDQSIPDRLTDADLTLANDKIRSSFNQCVSDAPIFHAKLAKIIGEMSSDLYPTNRRLTRVSAESAERWTLELKAWKESLPAFLEPTKVDPSILVPIFQRQSTVLRLAYAHALILANRSSLLSNFAYLNRPQNLAQGNLEVSVKECVDAAMLVVDTVNGFIEEGKMCKAFWFTHYISFCAIATLYIYTIQRSISTQQPSLQSGNQEQLYPWTHFFKAAEKCQISIAATTTKSSPFRRYNIILDELKREVVYRFVCVADDEPRVSGPHYRQSTVLELERSHGSLKASKSTVSQTTNLRASNPLDLGTENCSLNLQDPHQLGRRDHVQMSGALEIQPPHDTTRRLYDEPVFDMGLFGAQDGLMGWSEFDSCAISWPDGLEFYDTGTVM